MATGSKVFLITRNKPDYVASEIPVLAPDEFLARGVFLAG